MPRAIDAALDPRELAKQFALPLDNRGPAQRSIQQVQQIAGQDDDGDDSDLPGIKLGMRLYGKGRRHQLTGFKLSRAGEWKVSAGSPPLCLPTCQGYKSARKCADGCERGIIKRARESRDINF